MVWYFISVYTSRFEKHFTSSLRSLVKYFSTLEEKFRISKRPCSILYMFIKEERNNVFIIPVQIVPFPL